MLLDLGKSLRGGMCVVLRFWLDFALLFFNDDFELVVLLALLLLLLVLG
jgi:hypothetical protein